MDNLLQLIKLPDVWVLVALGLAVGVLSGALITALNGRVKRQQVEQSLQASESALSVLRDRNLVLETQQQALSDQLISVQSVAQREREQRERQLSEQQQQLSNKSAHIAALQKELELQQVIVADKVKTLDQTRQQLSQDFELLANRIFDEKTERFSKSSKSTIDTALSPLREQLKDFKQKVEDVYDKDSKERVSLIAELGQLKQLNQQMSADALSLTNALKGDNKAQGNWGEVILERVLEESGLTKGREYETQVSLKSESGRSQPDVIIRLPENKDLIIDSKVSLLHYERYCKSDDENEKSQALKEHVASVKNHIKGLSIKNYEALEGLRTLDFVFIFIPIESAFMAAFEHDQTMFREAYEKNIIVVGPTTLLATLRTIQSIWRYERQNKNAEEIARQAGAMHDKFVGFVTDLDKIADHLSKASQAHDSAMNKLKGGKGNLVGSTQRLEQLGAKVKKSIPDSVLDHDGLGRMAEIEESSNE
jgi:DNA recombination protein RmuC